MRKANSEADDSDLNLSDIEDMLDRGGGKEGAGAAAEKRSSDGVSRGTSASSAASKPLVAELLRELDAGAASPAAPPPAVAALIAELAAEAEAFEPTDYWANGRWDLRALREDVEAQRAELAELRRAGAAGGAGAVEEGEDELESNSEVPTELASASEDNVDNLVAVSDPYGDPDP